jgi:hypothetical protein
MVSQGAAGTPAPVSPVAAREATPARQMAMSDPLPIALGLFAFALAMYGVRFVAVGDATLKAGSTSVALDYALLVGGIAEVLGGVLAIIKGLGYPAYVVTIFGVWLIGFYLLTTSGAANAAFTPDAVAYYLFILVVPVAIMAVPAVVHRNIPFVVAFVAIIALLIVGGLGFHSLHDALVSAAATKSAPSLSATVDLLQASAWLAFIAAAAIWWVFASEVYQITGVLRGGT